MGIELRKPFGQYVAVSELPKTGDATKFVVEFPFQIEGTSSIQSRHKTWTYSDTLRAIDEKAGADGLSDRRGTTTEQLRRAIAEELDQTGARLYDSPDTKFPIWGKKGG